MVAWAETLHVLKIKEISTIYYHSFNHQGKHTYCSGESRAHFRNTPSALGFPPWELLTTSWLTATSRLLKISIIMKHYHTPSSSIVIIAHVVKGRQHSAHIWCPSHRDMESDTNSWPWEWQISMLKSQRWTWSHSTASKSGCGRHAIYSTG